MGVALLVGGLIASQFEPVQEAFKSLASGIKSVFNFVGNHNHWLITACCHTKDGVNFYNPLYPKYHDNIHYGENTISSPSVLMFKNENVIEFDENLCWLMDVDYYKMLYDKFGLPSICNYVTVVNRSHPDSITNSKIVDFDVKKEIEYVKNKYG